MRIVRVNQDLSGQTLNTAREGFFQNCNIDGVVFRGDFRGSDYLGCTGAADWSKALTYGSYWRGCDLTGAILPPDIGFLHHDPVGALIKDRATALPVVVKGPVTDVGAFALSGDYPTASWDTSIHLWWTGRDSLERVALVTGFRQVFAPYPGLAQRWEELVIRLTKGEELSKGNLPLSQVVTWPDGVEVTVDALNLPPLPEPSRHALARWIEGQAGPDRHCFVYSINPMNVRVLAEPDDWLTLPRGGF